MLWIVVMIGILLLFSGLSERTIRTGQIGEIEVPILRVTAEHQFIDNFIQLAAQYSMPATVSQTTGQPCTISTTDAATQAFNTKMNIYLNAYNSKTKRQLPTSNYELYIETGHITGIAIKPVNIPIQDFTTREIGMFSYHPNFKINYDHKLEQHCPV